MNQQLQDGYNEWLLKYGTRKVTFTEARQAELLQFVDKLENKDLMHSYFCKTADTHIYILQLKRK